jgi:glutamate carboxypeptidase
MNSHAPYIDWIDSQAAQMRAWVVEWSNVNSGTGNLAGIEKMTNLLRPQLDLLKGDLLMIPLPPASQIDGRGEVKESALGSAISVITRPEAPLRVLLAIHMDTVYPPDHPFQTTTSLDANKLQGPGVTDAKGGLAVLLKALEAFERSPQAQKLGWELLINPDEEIGSVSSASLLAQAAKRNHLGLLFEPALSDGAIVSARKGSGNFTIVIRGRSAHAGRDFAAGRSAIVALAELVTELHALNARLPELTINVGRIEGGGALNVVPDLAICRVNVRSSAPGDEANFHDALSRLLATINARDGLRAESHGGFTSPPKVMDNPTSTLIEHVIECGRDLGMTLAARPSGGTCDGNRLAAAGLPNIDSLGVRGDHIHSPQEYLLLDSLVERAKLAALLLMKLASGEIPWLAKQ